MSAIILKDLYLIKNYGKFLLFAILIMLGIGFFAGNMTTYIRMFVTIGLLLPFISSFSYDSMAKWEEYEAALPIRKANIAMSKYVEIIAIFVITLAISLIEDLSIVSLYIPCAMLFMLSVWIPVIYKFGAEKGRIVFMVMVGLATALAVAGSTMVENNFFDIFGGTMFNVIFFTTIIATFILSFLITLKVLINKEY